MMQDILLLRSELQEALKREQYLWAAQLQQYLRDTMKERGTMDISAWDTLVSLLGAMKQSQAEQAHHIEQLETTVHVLNIKLQSMNERIVHIEETLEGESAWQPTRKAL